MGKYGTAESSPLDKSNEFVKTPEVHDQRCKKEVSRLDY